MKRIIAAILTIFMLFALVPSNSRVNAAELGDAPYYCVNFVETAEEVPNVYWLPFFWTYPMDENTERAMVSCYGTSNDEVLAEVLKNDFNSRPKGARYFQLTLAQTAFHSLAEKAVYFDKSVAMIKDWLTDFLKMYKEMGGELDGIIVDTEFIDNHSYYLYDFYAGTRNKEENKYIYRDIVEDPRYEEQLRPLLEKYGFKFYENVGGEKSEIWCLNYRDYSTTGHDLCATIWNHATDIIEKQAINEAVLYPLLEYYPDANVSDYQSATQDTWQRASDNHGGEVFFNTYCAGNVSNANLYVGNPENSYYGWDTPVYNNPPSFNDAQFKATPFNMFMYDVNYFKNMYASTDDGKIDVWHANYEYGIGNTGYPSTYSGTPYYTEAMYHVGLLNPQIYLGYMITSDAYNDCITVSDIMQELTRLVGASDRKPLKPQASWNGSYVLSGMYAAGRNIWRLTPDTDVANLKDFKISSNNEDPTFCIDGLTITFPGGTIIKDGPVHRANSCGFWIETAKDVEPVITATDDRYRKNPSLLEDFEGYRDGATFTTAWALPQGTWNVEGVAKVRQNGNNKALALTGTATIENVQLPENISAGDEYAKQQAWEVSVTLPENLSSLTNIQLLTAYSGDRGIKVANGHVFYDDGQQYQAIDGVSIIAGNTYNFKREFDFRTTGNYTCSYSVYDASGNMLGEVKDVKIKSTSLPIKRISISITDANEAVLIDNYKLYPTGVTSTLALYDAQIGTKVTSLSESRTTDTVYRMSWLNATNEDKVACIYNQLTGDVIREVLMKAGLDGVVTGIVEASSGDAVQLAVSHNKVPSTNDDENDVGGDDNDDDAPTVEEPTDGTEAIESTEPSVDNSDSTQPSTEPKDDGTTQPTITEPSETPDLGGSDKVKLGTGAIVAIIISAVVFAAAAAVALILILKKKSVDNPTSNVTEAECTEHVPETENVEDSVDSATEA